MWAYSLLENTMKECFVIFQNWQEIFNLIIHTALQKTILFANFYLFNFNTIYVCDRHISLDAKYKFSLRSDNSRYLF